MKIIDLLNKIANGEEVPKRIKTKNDIWIYDDKDCGGIDYRASDDRGYMFEVHTRINKDDLNEEVEIIKGIPEKLPIGLKATKENEILNTLIIGDSQYELNEKENIICKKIHEIIDYLKSKGE